MFLESENQSTRNSNLSDNILEFSPKFMKKYVQVTDKVYILRKRENLKFDLKKDLMSHESRQ